jgi:hypothetical protein
MQFAGVDIRKKLPPGICQAFAFWRRNTLALRFPFPDHLLGALPVTESQRPTYLLPVEPAINPDRTLTVSVLPALRAMLATLAVAAIARQH